MELFFSPMACSLASRIALYEIGAEVRFLEVGPDKKTEDGADYRAIHPLGLVPALRDEGVVLTENAAILQRLAARFPEARLAPTDDAGRGRLQQWLSFVGTELHKTIFAPIFDRGAPEAVKAYALAKAPARLDVIAAHLAEREHLLDAFSVADAYAFTALNWTQAVPALPLTRWPALAAYVKRLAKRPSIARAIAEELPRYRRSHAEPAS